MKLVPSLLTIGCILSGCVAPIGNSTSSSLNEAASTSYLHTNSQGTVSRHCLKATRSGFGRLPPGCLVDTVFADQVAYPHDLTTPHSPGASHPRTTALGASDYLLGDGATERAPLN